MSPLVFDDDAARAIEAIYLIGDAVRRRAIVRAALGAQPGERVLDVGCGPGYYCAELLEQVGPRARWSASTAARRCSRSPSGAARGTGT